jgi:hypothetical protein
VTFKDAQALDTALLLSGAVIVDQAVNIFPLEDEVRTTSTTTSMLSEHHYTESRSGTQVQALGKFKIVHKM